MKRKKIFETFECEVHSIYGVFPYEIRLNINVRDCKPYDKVKALFVKEYGLGAWNFEVYDVVIRVKK